MSKRLVENIALTIRKLRKANNISQEELADRSGLDRTYISGVERGVRNITLDSLEAIVNALKIDLTMFLDEVIDSLRAKDKKR